MPQFTYGGVELDLDWLVSYTRVSSPQQTLEHGGGGIDRQLEEFHDFAATFGVPQDTSLGSLIDEGKSGSTGKNVETGALGLFRTAILEKRVKPKTGLVVESFSRLNRLVIDKALTVFLEIVCENNVPLITLQDRRAYTVQSFRRDKGVIHQIGSAMHSARDHAENIWYYSTKAWRNKRRGSCTNITPSWIVVEDGALVADPAKAAIVVRIFHMALTMGVNSIVAALNAEGVPVLNERKRKRSVLLWGTGSITKLLRGRQVLGQQEVGHYVDGKRVVTKGQYVDAYPAIVDKALWDAVQVKLDSRRSGVSTGRNVQRYTNLFGDLARCRCGERMKIHRRGNRGEYVYLGCSAHRDGACKNAKFYRLDHIEAAVLDMIANLTWPTDTQGDPTAGLEKQIAKAKADAAALETAYERAMLRSGTLAERTAAKLEADHAAKLASVTKLERELAVLKMAKPADQQLSALKTLSERLQRLSGTALVEARGKVATALPGLFRAITFAPDQLAVTVRDGQVLRLGEWVGGLTTDKVGWHLFQCREQEKLPTLAAYLKQKL